MKTFKIVTVVGARPHFIKSAALSIALDKSNHLKQVLVHSGQHYDDELSGQFFLELGLMKPDYNLQIGSKPHNLQIGECISKLDAVLERESPSMVLVLGDTNTTLAAAIATKKRNIHLGHVEAGLREFDRSIPEEINKLVIDAISDLYFVPTKTGIKNLLDQGITENVFLTGDIGLDLLMGSPQLTEDRSIALQGELPEKYVFMTCHREANTTLRENLKAILEAVSALTLPVLFSVHPRTSKAIHDFNLGSSIGSNISLLPPLGFWDTQRLVKGAQFVITDSGGIIKEAYFHEVPAIIIDHQTEWVESVEEGWSVLTGPDRDRIMEASVSLSRPEVNLRSLGDGKAGERIVHGIEQFLKC